MIAPRVVAVLLPALAVAISVGPATADSDLAAEEERLEETENELSEIRDELEGARDSVDEEEAALEVAEARVDRVVGAVEEVRHAVERQQETVQSAREEFAELEEEVDRHEARLQDRIAEMYRDGSNGALGPVMDSEDPGAALATSALLDAVNRSDRLVFEDLESTRALAEEQAQRLEEEEEILEAVVDRKERLLADVEELREDRAMQLAEVEERIAELESHEEYLEGDQAAIAAEIERIEEEAAEPEPEPEPEPDAGDEGAGADGAAGAGSAASDSGDEESDTEATTAEAPSGEGWTWPASGPITSGFGQRWGRLHAGIDIANSAGSPVMAARSGTVAFAGSQGGYGQTVIVNHPGPYQTLYAHLSSIETSVGASVSAGQRIGGMGCTGSCTGTHLHFEIHVEGQPRNPLGFLP
ncbi:hypothetical protein ER308_18985 [Egibacter rhizosphaerae]|uniref:M23ase beta-sheet core domain-containing protein n=1 Tax=Egibacter rhizosphaerae TaxID=1670831 RepID=A0A411YJT1_9ACTN|nr:M23 family metallopeptidase [Egibacter rhizosphaerae]QBI21447.1 hypothetical protein ER308_18985 [Egibacter rhizosphaerae]